MYFDYQFSLNLNQLLIFLKVFFAFSGFIDSTAEECDRKLGGAGGDTQPCRESNPGPLQSLGTWVACATDLAKRRPNQLLISCNKTHPHRSIFHYVSFYTGNKLLPHSNFEMNSRRNGMRNPLDFFCIN